MYAHNGEHPPIDTDMTLVTEKIRGKIKPILQTPQTSWVLQSTTAESNDVAVHSELLRIYKRDDIMACVTDMRFCKVMAYDTDSVIDLGDTLLVARAEPVYPTLLSKTELQETKDELINLYADMHTLYGFVHGDLQWSNLVRWKGKLVFIDFESSRIEGVAIDDFGADISNRKLLLKDLDRLNLSLYEFEQAVQMARELAHVFDFDEE